MNRRRFLQAIGLGATAAAVTPVTSLATCAPAASKNPPPAPAPTAVELDPTRVYWEADSEGVTKAIYSRPTYDKHGCVLYVKDCYIADNPSRVGYDWIKGL